MNLINFDESTLIKYVEMLIDADEVERALLVLDNVPAYYRDHPTATMTKLKGEILSAMVTAHAYMSSDLDAQVRPELAIQTMRTLLRGQLVLAECRRKSYHIVDVGPGEYFIPLALKQLGISFSYTDVVMDSKTQLVAHPLLASVSGRSSHEACLFLALEIIEHLADPRELAVEALRHCKGWPERIHLSTPCYTYDGSRKTWRKPCGLPHLRAYTPREFIYEVQAIFPGYQLEFHPGPIMSIRGQRSDSIDPVPLDLTIDF